MHESSVDIWTICSDCDAGLLRSGKSQSLVRTGIRFLLCPGIGVRIPAGRLAVRPGGSGLVGCGVEAVVAEVEVN